MAAMMAVVAEATTTVAQLAEMVVMDVMVAQDLLVVTANKVHKVLKVNKAHKALKVHEDHVVLLHLPTSLKALTGMSIV